MNALGVRQDHAGGHDRARLVLAPKALKAGDAELRLESFGGALGANGGALGDADMQTVACRIGKLGCLRRGKEFTRIDAYQLLYQPVLCVGSDKLGYCELAGAGVEGGQPNP